jgi:hypothetical protein
VSVLANMATGFGLSTAAGLNAYLPLLIVALLARFSHLIVLKPPYDVLSSEWAIGVLLVLLTIEVFVDKIPAVDTINDGIQTFIRPVAGAVLFAASAHALDLHPAVALACGLLLAGGVHAAKATARPLVTASSGGLLNPVVSAAEDFLSAVTSIVAIVFPLAVVFLVLFLAILFIVWYRKRRTLKSIQREEKPGGQLSER